MDTDKIYIFDGSLEGFFTVFFDCYNEFAAGIYDIRPVQTALNAEYITVETDFVKASRVANGIIRKTSKKVFDNVQIAFLHADPDKFLTIFDYLKLAFKHGKSNIDTRLTEHSVIAMQKWILTVSNEANDCNQFCRFLETEDGILYSRVSPVHNVIGLMAEHFSDRFRTERFLIHDIGRNIAAAYDKKGFLIADVPRDTVFSIGKNEKGYRELWNMFHKTIANEGRRNKKLQTNNMPKRHQRYAVEFNFDDRDVDSGFELIRG